MIKTYFASTDIIQKTDEDYLKKMLSPDLKSRLAGLKRNEDKSLLLTTSVLLTRVLCENGHENYKVCDLQYSKTGRPFFPDSKFDFNISHTGNLVAIAFSEDCRVGIDIERITDVDFSDFENIFSREIWDNIYSSEDKIRKFYHYWTLLESAVKADGRGLSLTSAGCIKIKKDVALIEGKRWYFYHNDACTAISCCITSDKDKEIVDFKKLNSLF